MTEITSLATTPISPSDSPGDILDFSRQAGYAATIQFGRLHRMDPRGKEQELIRQVEESVDLIRQTCTIATALNMHGLLEKYHANEAVLRDQEETARDVRRKKLAGGQSDFIIRPVHTYRPSHQMSRSFSSNGSRAGVGENKMSIELKHQIEAIIRARSSTDLVKGETLSHTDYLSDVDKEELERIRSVVAQSVEEAKTSNQARLEALAEGKTLKEKVKQTAERVGEVLTTYSDQEIIRHVKSAGKQVGDKIDNILPFDEKYHTVPTSSASIDDPEPYASSSGEQALEIFDDLQGNSIETPSIFPRTNKTIEGVKRLAGDILHNVQILSHGMIGLANHADEWFVDRKDTVIERLDGEAKRASRAFDQKRQRASASWSKVTTGANRALHHTPTISEIETLEDWPSPRTQEDWEDIREAGQKAVGMGPAIIKGGARRIGSIKDGAMAKGGEAKDSVINKGKSMGSNIAGKASGGIQRLSEIRAPRINFTPITGLFDDLRSKNPFARTEDLEVARTQVITPSMGPTTAVEPENEKKIGGSAEEKRDKKICDLLYERIKLRAEGKSDLIQTLELITKHHELDQEGIRNYKEALNRLNDLATQEYSSDQATTLLNDWFDESGLKIEDFLERDNVGELRIPNRDRPTGKYKEVDWILNLTRKTKEQNDKMNLSIHSWAGVSTQSPPPNYAMERYEERREEKGVNVLEGEQFYQYLLSLGQSSAHGYETDLIRFLRSPETQRQEDETDKQWAFRMKNRFLNQNHRDGEKIWKIFENREHPITLRFINTPIDEVHIRESAIDLSPSRDELLSSIRVRVKEGIEQRNASNFFPSNLLIDACVLERINPSGLRLGDVQRLANFVEQAKDLDQELKVLFQETFGSRIIKDYELLT